MDIQVDETQEDPLRWWAQKISMWVGQYAVQVDDSIKVKGTPDKSSAQNSIRAIALDGGHHDLWFDAWDNTDKVGDDTVNDNHVTGFKAVLENRFRDSRYIPSVEAVRNAIYYICSRQQRNSRREEIESIVWDEEDRWPGLAAALQQEPDDELSFEACKLIVRGVVIRILEPGSDFPYCPVIYSSKQGVGKGDFLKLLSGGRYAQMDRGILGMPNSQEKILERCRGRSIVEIGEYNGIKGKSLDTLKSAVTDNIVSGVRLAYGRMARDWKATHIFVGTTNSSEFLSDTENRRSVVLTIPDGKSIDLQWIAQNRDQLYAQVIAEYKFASTELAMEAQNQADWTGGGFQQYMDDTVGMVFTENKNWRVQIPRRFWAAMEERARDHRETTSLMDWLDGFLTPYGNDALLYGDEIMNQAKAQFGTVHSKDLSDAMQANGLVRVRKQIDGHRVHLWGQPGATIPTHIIINPMDGRD